ncbi:hypothetical protein E7T09_15845 [Deinococcus sp. KSM4-11]|uniref:hypothetical protein n=1 Tax=Deinococcus sp. KSM4-11 TaxID=2568654 RepID=UPI0010A41E4C|nr:hypothetical protein [Deinococcus sp. KSM4-11]THF85439.1 hypothetical protein E7T09_15845 [Deinococcus sp. KSM4-11]
MTDVLVAPGAWARLDMALGEHRVELISGEISVVFTRDRRTMSAGETQVIPAGIAFGLLNTVGEPTHLRISVVAAQLAGAGVTR